ncbi:KxYKxGKxW signal peptide domain-containing protein [Leuconostoc citreum]
MGDNDENKRNNYPKKLYKSGKSWVAAATAFAVMGVSAVTTVSADTQTPFGTTQSQQDLTGQRGQDKPTTKEVIDKRNRFPRYQHKMLVTCQQMQRLQKLMISKIRSQQMHSYLIKVTSKRIVTVIRE